MQINVRFLDNLRLEASFDDFTILTDQPVRYKGDGTAPSPFDYFLASSALCAAYFVKVYCLARNIPTQDIRLSQNNIVDPDNRYNQIFHIQIELPESISAQDREGILKAMDRCTVKKVIQTGPDFKIEAKDILGADASLMFAIDQQATQTIIPGKDRSLEETITHMTGLLERLGIKIEIASWRNPVPHVWSVHIRDADSPICFTNGKGATKNAALCSALGEYLERISSNYFYSDFYLGEELAHAEFVHYPNEKWFAPGAGDALPAGLMDEHLLRIYNQERELKASHLIDTNSGNRERGICALPFERQSDLNTVYIPVNLIGNLFVSNGMSAGNSKFEARVQALSEIFERAVKNQIITQELTLPDVPQSVLEEYPKIMQGIRKLEEQGFPVFVKDASLGGQYPVMCVAILNPRTGGAYASFGAHPLFEVALERGLTELLQGRSFEGLNDMPAPTFNQLAVQDHNNLIDHFIDSTGVVSWKFFSGKADYAFKRWNFSGTTEQEFKYLMGILRALKKEVYIADFEDLGAPACRILVPDYSEIYLKEDLIWDNNNQALNFRSDILNLHRQSDDQLSDLVERLEESGLDNYLPVSELIGVTFEETSTWGQLVLGELKCLIYLALGNHEVAKELVEQLLTFNENLAERKKFFRALGVVLDITLRPDLELNDYLASLSKMFGPTILEQAVASVNGSIRFHGLTATDSNLQGLEKHQRLLESYQKLQLARKKAFR
jgi:ribosomal protein S12 methylthiotransferase accessory factor